MKGQTTKGEEGRENGRTNTQYEEVNSEIEVYAWKREKGAEQTKRMKG